MKVVEKLAALGLRLPPPHNYSKPNRTGCVVVGNLAYVSGHLPVTEGGERITGKVDADLSEAQAYEASRRAALSMLSSLEVALGSLDRVRRVVKVVGVVNASPGFQRPFAVIDGASDLFVELWGPERGRHARTTYGVAETSANMAVEIEGLFEIGE
jgi:enamine deaminase RidA (YjgF/YER057c/UK114 family)